MLTMRMLAGYAWLRLIRPILGTTGYDARLIELHRKNSRRLTRAIVDLGGLFIKVGQLISALTNFLPAEFRAELEQLQDSVPARPFDEVRARIRKELGEATRRPVATHDEIAAAAAELGRTVASRAVLVTLSEDGMLLAAELYVRRYGHARIRCAKLHHPSGGHCHFRCQEEATT